MEKSTDLLEWVKEPTDIMSGKAYAYSLIFERLTPPEISTNIFFRKPDFFKYEMVS